MGDIELVIKMPEDEYNFIKAQVTKMGITDPLRTCVASGKPIKTGHWIVHPHEAGENFEFPRYECSECSEWADDDSDFCPYCGVKMEEINPKIDLGDEVVGDFGAKGVVVGIDTHNGEVWLLMREHTVPQRVKVSSYKTKTGKHFPQITEVLEQMKGEADGK